MSSVQDEIAKVRHWRHTIELPGGVITPGSQNTLEAPKYFGLPENLAGKTVLDIGCSDGFFSFECEKRGASYVLAIDNFSSVYVDSPSGFHIAHKLLQSKVEFREIGFFDLDPQEVGQFDLVLFLGVLYHLRHPLLALERLGALCKGQCILETLLPPRKLDLWYVPKKRGLKSAVRSWLLGEKRHPEYMEFYEGDEINHDPTVWWAPSPSCMQAMLRSCGFCSVKCVRGGIFHAFHPRYGDDVKLFIASYGKELVAQACQEVLGQAVDAADLADFLSNISIPRFAAVKQRVTEIKAKHWHQVERLVRKD